MTTGERLVDISTLSTGTALEHFLNISTGTGGETIYVDRMLSADVSAVAIAAVVDLSQVAGAVEVTELAGAVLEEAKQAEVSATNVSASVGCDN